MPKYDVFMNLTPEPDEVPIAKALHVAEGEAVAVLKKPTGECFVMTGHPQGLHSTLAPYLNRNYSVVGWEGPPCPVTGLFPKCRLVPVHK